MSWCNCARAAAIAVATLLAAIASPAAPLPGAAPHPPELAARLRAATSATAGPPRTRHREPDGTPMYTNRLVLEASPYLRQHAHNPVDWYPWGDEAFARARAAGRPVLLSVGYSTCHWCHVMEEESFEDLEIAEYLNRHYIAIKVDRERRPDVDGLYLQALQVMGHRGGWPMTVWLTPDRQPFYGGTYYPPHDGDRGQPTGLLTLLRTLRTAYAERPSEIAAAAGDLSRQVRASLELPGDPTLPGRAALDRAVHALRAQYDPGAGGFGSAPKFPRPVQLELLLRYARRSGDATTRAMVERTLERMAAGGIHDQLGGGFHRYATDAGWQVPHFEKMLSDNALLTLVYLEAAQAMGRADFAGVARDILDYVRREMTDPAGGFYAATDADSDGREGAYFVWTPAELAAALDPDDRALVAGYYGVSARGNFAGATVLHVAAPLEAVARAQGIPLALARERLERGRHALLAARAARTPPHTDRKVLAAWNGLMISAFARAGAALADPEHIAVAARAASHLLEHMRLDGRLRRTALDGAAGGDAYLDDYANVITGLLDLFEATGDPRWLRAALELEQVVDTHYRDRTRGAYFLTADDAEALLAREAPAYDGAEPSGNSVMVLALLRLHELTGDDRYRARADAALRALGPVLARDPLAMPRLLSALDFSLDRAKQIVIVVPTDRAEAEPFLVRLGTTFVPNRALVTVAARDRDALAPLVPLVAGKVARDGLATAYVCERRVCALPTTDPAVFSTQLGRVEPLPQQ